MEIFIGLFVILGLYFKFVIAKDYPKKGMFHLYFFMFLTIMTLTVMVPLSGQITHSFSDTFLLADTTWRHPLLFFHIALATPCTLLAPLLVFKPYRRKYRSQHRLAGKLYVVGALISAILILPLCLTHGGGFVPRLGFTTMSVLWFSFTLKAYLEIRKGNFIEHERWMLRSYAMTFAFVHVNVTFPLIHIYDVILDPVHVKILQSMVSWSMNLLFVELYLFKRKKKNSA